jgi:putative RecB family exonuclease
MEPNTPSSTRTPVAERPRTSHTRVETWTACPTRYARRYIERAPVAGPDAARDLGIVVHATLERLEQEAVDAEGPAALSAGRAREVYREEWSRSGLTDPRVFVEGHAMVLGFVEDRGVLPAGQVIGIELPFVLPIGPFDLHGVIDRIEREPDGTILVADYKTGRLLPGPGELEAHVQLSLYEAAVRALLPDARRVRLELWMVRHRTRLATSRTAEQVQAAIDYVTMATRQFVAATEFPARLGAHCAYCDYRTTCSAYGEALAAGGPVAAVPAEDLASLAVERAQLAELGKLVDRRKRAIDAVIRKRLAREPEVVAGGTRFRLFDVVSRTHALSVVLPILSRATGRDPAELAAELGAVDDERLNAVLEDVARRRGVAHGAMVRAEVEALARERKTQRLWATSA